MMLPALLLLAGSLTTEMWSSIENIYARTLQHPFLQGLISGNLPKEKFQFYLEQDALYLNAFAEALRITAGKAPRKDWAETLRRHAAESIEAEKQLLETVLKMYGSSRAAAMAPTNRAYTNHLLATAARASFRDALAALLPCYWIYWEVGKQLNKSGSQRSEYRQWIEQYADQGYGKVVEEVLAMMNAEGESMNAAERKRAIQLFTLGARYEYMFWDMAWRLEAWPP
ncbi:MAG: thiaminase II [Acidimicrobiia bacterium]|nr:thiaminase II [Acidimicrobiia bacterium]